MNIRTCNTSSKNGSRTHCFILAVFLAGLSTCGGRVSTPITAVQEIDSLLTCQHLRAEISNHEKRAKELLGEKKDQGANNLGFLITSPLFLDFNDTEKKEIKALADRDAHVAELQKQKNCPIEQAIQTTSPISNK